MKQNLNISLKSISIFNKKNFKINLSWLVFDKIFRASLNIALSIILARSLGPENFGILSYLLAFLFLFTTFSSIGMNPLLTNSIIKGPRKSSQSKLINAYYIRFFASLISYILFILIIFLFNKNQIYTHYSLILGLGIVLKSSEVFFSHFEANSQSKYIVISQLIGLVFSLLLILYIVNKDLDYIFIYCAITLDALIVFVLINFFFFLKTKIIFTRFNFSESKKIFLKSFPILVSALSIILYMRIDQIMIKSILNEYSLGIYSASVRYVEIFHFIPKIIIISFLPILLKKKNYQNELLKLNSICFKLSILSFIIIFSTSSFMIEFIFGQTYKDSILVTKILSVSIIFVFFGVINEHWYVKNNLQKYYAFNVLLGAIINILLNYYFIKLFGIIGAAYSTIITYFFIIFIFDFIIKKTSEITLLKLKSIIKL